METILTAVAIIAFPAAFIGYRRYMPRRERAQHIEHSILELLFEKKHPFPDHMIYRRLKKAGHGDLGWDEFQLMLNKVAKSDEVFSWVSANSGYAQTVVYQHVEHCVMQNQLAA